MQILLGTHQTIIKINSDSIKIDYIQNFISTHFLDRTIEYNCINIPKSTQNSHHRIFLLKWLYTLYSKKTNNIIPELKDILIQRHTKAIKIKLKKKIIHRIIYTVVDKETINIQIIPANSKIAYKIRTYLNVKFTLLPTSMQIKIDTDKEKKHFKNFLKTNHIINIAHEHIYKKKDIENFCNNFIKPQPTRLDEAYAIFGLSSYNLDKQSLKRQYKKLAKQFHPDKAISQDQQTINLYTKKFQNILDAYEILQLEKF